MKSLLVSAFVALISTQAFAIDVGTPNPTSKFDLEAFLAAQLGPKLPEVGPALAFVPTGICLRHEIDTDDGAVICDRKVNFVLPQIVGATSASQVEKLATSFTDYNPAFVQTALLDLPDEEPESCQGILPNGKRFCSAPNR